MKNSYSFRDAFGDNNYSHNVEKYFDQLKVHHGSEYAERCTRLAITDATFGRGPLAGKTGDLLKDDPAINPWVKGNGYDRGAETGNFPFLAKLYDDDISPEQESNDTASSQTEYVLTDQAKERVKSGSLILISSEVDVLTPAEREIFERALGAMHATRGIRPDGLSLTFKKHMTGLDAPKVFVPEDMEPHDASIYLCEKRHHMLAKLEERLGGYVSDEDWKLLDSQDPSFEARSSHEIPLPVERKPQDRSYNGRFGLYP